MMRSWPLSAAFCVVVTLCACTSEPPGGDSEAVETCSPTASCGGSSGTATGSGTGTAANTSTGTAGEGTAGDGTASGTTSAAPTSGSTPGANDQVADDPSNTADDQSPAPDDGASSDDVAADDVATDEMFTDDVMDDTVTDDVAMDDAVGAGGNAGETDDDSEMDDLGETDPDDAVDDSGMDGTTVVGDDLCDVGVFSGDPPQVLQLSGNTFAHDPTMIEDNGVFYRFWTGDNIPMASSTDLRSWQNGPSVYSGGYPAWVSEWRSDNPGNTFNFPWAPDVSRFAGKVHIYSSFSAFFGRNISCITHLSTTDVASGDWTDHGPVICTEGNEDYNAIDADVALDVDGTPWLSFGSFWGGIQAFELDQDGNRVGDELYNLAWAREIEAPVLFRRCGYYYLFVTWGLCCPGEGRSVNDLSYRVAVGRSENIMGPYVDRDGVAMVEGGGTLLVQGDGVNFAAAGHSDVIVSGDTIYHFYHAYRQSNGGAELRIVEMPFDDEGWPVPGGP